MVEEPQVGVDQSDSLLIASINDDCVSSRARWSCDVVNATLHRHTEGTVASYENCPKSPGEDTTS